MGIMKTLLDKVNPKKGAVATQETQGQIFLNPLCSNAENVFPQVRPLIDEMKMVRPYGVGRNGARLSLARTPELAILDYPNEEMGWPEFADLMFSMWLTESELNIHVWRNGRGKIYGYSILPVNSRVSLGNGEEYFQVTQADGTIEQLTIEEVLSLRFSRNPRNISQGVSPASSVATWSQVDDLLAQYQKAFLENGAVPAHITIIRASTQERYLAKRHELENGLHGARNKNKTIFIWRQMLDDGNEADEVEVKTIQGNNATLAIKDIMSVVNDKLNKAFGVSNFILGDDSSAKYDNAELSDRQFTKRRVYPALVSFWGQFQHELDRITGGLGYSIQFDLEIPELTDRLKIKTEISEKNVSNLISLIEAGSAPGAAVRALNLGEDWLDVAHGLFSEKNRQVTTQNEPFGQVSDNSTTIDNSLSVHDHHNHICSHEHDAYAPTFSTDEVNEKFIYIELEKVIKSAIAEELGEGIVLSDKEMDEIVRQVGAKIIEVANLGANDGAKEIKGLVLGDTAKEIESVLKSSGYHVSDSFENRLNKRTDTLVKRLNATAREKARQILNSNSGEVLSAAEIKKQLAEVMPNARAATIARNETVYAFRAGKLENDKYLAQKYGLKLKKIWRCTKDKRTCPICRAMDGQEAIIDEAFTDSVENKDGIAYSWEHSSWNEDGNIPSAHVNCRCHFETEVIHDEN